MLCWIASVLIGFVYLLSHWFLHEHECKLLKYCTHAWRLTQLCGRNYIKKLMKALKVMVWTCLHFFSPKNTFSKHCSLLLPPLEVCIFLCNSYVVFGRIIQRMFIICLNKCHHSLYCCHALGIQWHINSHPQFRGDMHSLHAVDLRTIANLWHVI